jgi:hypothetical protein
LFQRGTIGHEFTRLNGYSRLRAGTVWNGIAQDTCKSLFLTDNDSSRAGVFREALASASCGPSSGKGSKKFNQHIETVFQLGKYPLGSED